MLRLSIALALVAPAKAHAGRATCSNPGVPIGAGASKDLLTGQLSLSLTTSLLPIHSEEELDEGTGPVLFDEHVKLLETRLTAEYTVLPWLAVGGSFPYRVVDVDLVHRDPATGDEVTVASDIHARDETLEGVGDPSIGVHAAREVGGWRLHGRGGVSIPLGRTEEDPHLLGSIGQEHQHIQLGTGTWVPYAAAEAQHGFGSVTGSVWGLAHVSLADNEHGYRAGDRYSLGVTASFSPRAGGPNGLRAWTFGLAVEGHAETAETWGGMVYETEGNAGRFDLMVGASAGWRPLPGLAVIADLKRPVYSHVSGTQLDYGFVFGIGIATTIETRRKPSWHGLDEKIVASPGTETPLVPVPGKVTVFDLWATWCAPCRELDDRLVAFARTHDIAVRKLDVVDPDSAAWKQHLAPGSFELPHIKVYGADGKLLFEATAPPAELIKKLEAVL